MMRLDRKSTLREHSVNRKDLLALVGPTRDNPVLAPSFTTPGQLSKQIQIFKFVLHLHHLNPK